jgi:hypothetical protein
MSNFYREMASQFRFRLQDERQMLEQFRDLMVMCYPNEVNSSESIVKLEVHPE